ncbi:AsmA family protein [Chitinophaga varians]|uniref:AsmA family protein n=1 Tax=Chitinophaga varians TaxID=2202339 RepID=UPI00165FEFCD|nr:AsmA family protein [Chitinophaga varians]MBC9910070.1 AsmA family protein [Chitinophaga varians]
MRKWLKVVLIAGGSLIALIILLSVGLALYIKGNKAAFLKQITDQLNDNINGKLSVEDMEPSLFRSFPNVSIALKKVQLQDSLWQQHHHALLDLDYIFVRVNTLSLLRKHVDVKEISLEKGNIYLYTDSSGYTNTSALSTGRSAKKNGPSKDADIRSIVFSQITFTIDNQQKFKLFELDIQEMDGKLKSTDSGMHLDMRAKILARNFSFNTNKGSYLKGKTLGLDLSLFFNKKTRQLIIPEQQIKIDKTPVRIAGVFDFSEKPPPFRLKINADQVLLQEAASWLSPNISSKLSTIHLTAPLDAEANLQGHMKFRDTPRVVVTWKTTKNTLVTAAGEWSNCSFSGRFNNEVVPGAGHNDENSAVNIFALKASLGEVPLEADTIRVVNLKQPLLRGHFRSQFPLANLNTAASDVPLLFSEGTAAADLYYTGPVLKTDNTPSALEGTVQIQRGGFTYLPRDLTFHDCSATLQFTGQDLLVRNVRIQSRKSALQMEGTIRNMMNLYFTAPEKIELDWKIRSALVDLNEFRSFLTTRKGKKASHKTKAKTAGRVGQQLDKVLASSNVKMDVALDKVVFEHFTAQNVKALIAMTESDLLLNKIAFQHAGGTAQASGTVHQQGVSNVFKVNANITNVHIGQLFYAFNNFGLDGLQSKNLQGIVSAKADIKGNVLDNGTLAKNSLYGTVNFSLRNGALLNFGPLEDIGTFLFRRRRLDSITFENLSSTFQIQGNKILIPPMRIASSAVNIDVNGVYGLAGGTNINLDVPLRNPAKDSAITDKAEKRRRSRKGIILHLHAVSGSDGKVKIKLGKGD